MPFYKSNKSALDKAKPLEVVLELSSFSGGENTIGSDHELTSNESRIMENWEATSLGGMERSAGFDLLASGNPTIGSAVFDGTGTDDCTASGTFDWTEYALASGSSTYEVEIIDTTTASTPDLFKWSRDDLCLASGVAVPLASGYTMSEGVDVTWTSASGHTLYDKWSIPTYVPISYPDLVMQAEASGTQTVYCIIDGNIYAKDEDGLDLEDIDAFTSGELCHGISVNDQCWITNSADNLKTKVMGGNIETPSDQPSVACDRIYYHKFRLIAEGGGKTVYGSRVQPGYWNAADAWSATNDAWEMTLPDETQGMVIGFPSGDDVTVFTKSQAFSLYNFPSVAHKPIGSIGCAAPYSIAVGNEGAYFVSKFPNIAVVLWNGVTTIDITEKQDFVNDINFDQRIFGRYKGRKYYLFYASIATAADYPDTLKVFDAIYSRWYTRTLNPDVGDNFGYPAIMGFTDNELYIGSSRYSNIYELDGDYTSDNDYNTSATYLTKNFSSRDFSLANGGDFPLNTVRIKLTKTHAIMYGTEGSVTMQWESDRGRYTGQQVFDINTDQTGDLINTTFVVNTSYILGIPDVPDKTIMRSFSNNAIGRSFNFQINTEGSGTKPVVKKIKIHGIAYEEA